MGLLDWVTQQRASLWGGATYYLNLITRPAEESRWRSHDAFQAPLPAGVTHAFGMVSQVVPSLTLVTLQFVFADETARIIDTEMRRRYETVIRPSNPEGTYIIEGPAELKRHGVLRARRALRVRCETWFREHLPGYFAAGAEGGFPSCEFLTLRTARPFERVEPRSLHHYVRTLGLESDWDVYASTDYPGVSLRIERFRSDDSQGLLLGGKFDEVFPDKALDGYGPRSRDSVCARLFHLGNTVTDWAASVLLQNAADRLGEVRDQSAGIDLSCCRSAKATRREIDRTARFIALVHTHANELDRDLSPIVAELSALKPHPNKGGFYPVDKSYPEQSELFESIMKGIAVTATRFASAWGGVNQTLSRAATLVETASARAMERQMFWMTVVGVVTALFALVVGGSTCGWSGGNDHHRSRAAPSNATAAAPSPSGDRHPREAD
jgi:hypothetical protein